MPICGEDGSLNTAFPVARIGVRIQVDFFDDFFDVAFFDVLGLPTLRRSLLRTALRRSSLRPASVPSSFLFLVVRPGAPSSVLAPSSDAMFCS